MSSSSIPTTIELDEPKLRAIYQHGREKAQSMLEDVKRFLAE